MTFDELEQAVARKSAPADLFGPDIEAGLRSLRIVAHPDRNPAIRQRAEALTAALILLADQVKQPPVSVKSKTRVYALGRTLGIGDVADVFHATTEDKDFVFKVSRVVNGDFLLDNERAKLTMLLTAAKGETYSYYLPTLVESFVIKDRIAKRANVFTFDPGWYSLEQLAAIHPSLCDRHLVWIFNRLLTVLGFVHLQNVVHGAITPAHVLVHPESHGLRLVGWGHSVNTGEVITSAPAKYLPHLPPEIREKKPATAATDIRGAATAVGALAGLHPRTMNPGLVRFFAGCVFDAPRMRPNDAWTLLEEFKELARNLYGPPRFVPLVMP